MSKKHNDGGTAFPAIYLNGSSGDYWQSTTEGMTLRDYFAAKAMQGIVSVLQQGIRLGDVAEMASDAYLIADAMLKARV